VSDRATGIVVRRADSNEADARLLAALGARLFEDAFGAMNDPDDVRLFLARTYSPELQLAELGEANRATWFAEMNHEPVGYTIARRGSESPHVVARHPAEVLRIYADRAWHGRGVGGALMNACVEQARAWGCDVLWLGVWEQNARGIAFYEKWGFRRVGEQRFLVGTDSQRDHVMALGLT
jgi:GNAT superfamily N-acetyltransferase